MKAYKKPLIKLVPEGGLEPPQAQGPSDFESDASTSSTTPALCWCIIKALHALQVKNPI